LHIVKYILFYFIYISCNKEKPESEEHFKKFGNIYCSIGCLSKHRQQLNL
jgi:hypothetical protein